MVNATNIVYSISATAQILGVAKEAIRGFQVWGSCVWVWVKGSRPRFLSFKLYRQYFVDRRKRDAEGLQVFKSVMVGGYIVRNPRRDSKYICTPYRDRIECNWLVASIAMQRLLISATHRYASTSWRKHNRLLQNKTVMSKTVKGSLKTAQNISFNRISR
jgi:hypothetical protein